MNATSTKILLQREELTKLMREIIREEFMNFIPQSSDGVNLPDWLTRRQTAETLKISLSVLSKWAETSDSGINLLSPSKINGRFRYRKSDVLSVLKKMRKSDPSQTQIVAEIFNNTNSQLTEDFTILLNKYQARGFVVYALLPNGISFSHTGGEDLLEAQKIINIQVERFRSIPSVINDINLV